MKRSILLLLCLLYLGTGFLWAQNQKVVTGLITGDGEPLIGATVMAKGTTIGAITDFDGLFKLNLPEDVTHLIFSYTGYKESEMEIGVKTYFEVNLESSQIMLDEVVIAALGIEREKKALGYAVQDISADDLVEARSANVVNGLSGRIAGMQITSSSVPGGGSQVTIRGSSSILSNNQPLYVILLMH